MPNFDIHSTIQDVATAYPGRVAGRTFLITGATSGLGLAFAKFLAASGAETVIVTGRSEERCLFFRSSRQIR
jgi:NADP-dependent 3-hydroxy acid dehydrogenase YdfG